MKKFFKSVMLFAAAAMAFTACSDNDELESVVTPGEEAGELKLVATAEFENETRAEFEGGNGGQMIFSDGDKIMLNCQTPEGGWFYPQMTYDAALRQFTTYQTIKPIKDGSNIFIDAQETIPSVQENTYNNEYFNLKLLAFKADPVSFNSSMQHGNEICVPLTFQHVASYMQIRFVTEASELMKKAIKSVRFEATGVSSEGNSVQVNFDGLTAQPTAVNKADAKDYNNVAYLAVVPGTYTNGNFVVETMDGQTYTIAVPSKKFDRGHVHRIALNLKVAAPEPTPEPGQNVVFTRMTAANMGQLLKDGAEFIMVGFKNSDRYLSQDLDQWYGYLLCKEYATPVKGDLTAEQIGDARIFKFQQAADGTNWLFTTMDGQTVKYAGKEGNNLLLFTSETPDTTFEVVISDTKGARVKCISTTNRFISLEVSKARVTSRNVDLDIYVKVTK